MKYLRQLFISLFLVLPGFFSNATLGERQSSFEQDLTKLKGSQKAGVSNSRYSTHEMIVSGNTIKEFTNSDGVVFAVSWRGFSKPDLNVLFGCYFSEYKA